MAGYGFFDPDASLRATVEEAAAPRKLPDHLREALETLGGRIFRWLQRQLRARNVRNAHSEAQDLFQQVCARVFAWIRRKGAGVGVPWFWTVAKNVYANHLQRELVKKRDPEQSLDWDADETAWLLGRLDGSGEIESLDYWTEARIDDLVQRCIARLPERQRQFMVLDLVIRMPAPEIGTALGLKPKLRAALKAKALRSLRDEIRRELEKGPEPRRPPTRSDPDVDGT